MKKIFTLFVALCMAAVSWAEQITFDGYETNQYVPFSASYADEAGTKSQFIYRQYDIAELVGKSITGITFYAASNLTFGNNPPMIEIRMAEVQDSELTNFVSTEFTSVYSDRVPTGSAEMYCEFIMPFTYTGDGNLLVEVEVTMAGGYQSVSFYVASQTSGAYYKNGSGNSGRVNYVPKATFTCEGLATDFFITGNAALVGEDLAWSPSAIAVAGEIYNFPQLPAGEYAMKITTDGTWDSAKGYTDLTTVSDGLSKDDDGNITFTLTTPTDVTVTYTGGVFKVEGAFSTSSTGTGQTDATYYMKNNWESDIDWTWKEMTAAGNGLYVLENVVFGGTGVNYGTSASDDGATWVAVDAFLGDDIAAGDTVTFTLDPSAGTITATKVAQGSSADSDYYVVGVYPLLNKSWDITSQEGLLTKHGTDNYTYTIESLGLVAGQEYTYKIIANNSWDVDTYPRDDSNYSFTVEQTALYTVTFNFTRGSGCTATPTKIGDLEITTYTIMGDSALVGVDWVAGNTTNDMTGTGDGWQLTKKGVYLPAGTYHYEVAGNHDPRQYMYPVVWHEYTIEQAGTYDLTFTLTNPTTAPNLSLTATKGNYYLNGSDEHLGAWNWANSLPMNGDSIELTLPANAYEFKVYPQNTSGDNEMGYSLVNFECSSEGVTTSTGTYNANNIRVVLEQEGTLRVKVVEGQICVNGVFGSNVVINSYSLLGDSVLFGRSWDLSSRLHDMTKQQDDTYVYVLDSVFLNKDQQYYFKVVANHSWAVAQYPTVDDNDSVSVPQDGIYSITFTLDLSTAPTPSLTATVQSKGSGSHAEQLADGYYLVGTHNNWAPTSADLFTVNPEVDEEYILNTTLTLGNDLKVVQVISNENSRWFPDGDNIVVDAAHAGDVTIYFRPTYNPEWSDVGGYMYIVANATDPQDEIYSLLGTSALFGNDWDYSDTLTELTLQGESMYTYTIDSVALKTGVDYEYKVVTNHAVNVREWPSIEGGDNYHLTVEESGVYQVLFSFDPNSGCSHAANYLHAIVEPTVINLTCAEAAAAAMTVSANNEAYNNGATYSVYGYITAITTDYSSQYNNITFWMADDQAGGKVFEAYRCVLTNPDNIPTVGDFVKVTGQLTKYNTTPETVAGATCELIDPTTLCSGSGICGADGENIIWTLTCDSVLTLNGSGAMANYSYSSHAPWFTLHRYAIKQVIVSEGITNIGAYAFDSCSNVMHVQLPEGLQTIEKDAFRACHWLTTINFPSSLRSIGMYAFFNCYDLNNVIIPSGVESIGQKAFYTGSKMTDVTILSNTLCAADYKADSTLMSVFTRNVRTFTIGEGVTSIGKYAFYSNEGEDSLRTVIIRNGVTSIGEHAFSHQQHLESLSLPGTISQIGRGAFEHCYALTELTLPENVNNIGAYAFDSCYSITTLKLNEGLKSIERDAFRACSSISDLQLPGTLKTIGIYAFHLCYGLRSVVIPSNIDSIGHGAFYMGNYSLTDVTINSNTLCAKNYTTDGTLMNIFGRSVKTFTIGEEVTAIGSYAFYFNEGEDSLRTVILPCSVTSIGSYAFAEQKNLRSVYSYARTPATIGVNAFQNVDSACVLYVPAESVTAYQVNSEWSTFAHIQAADTTPCDPVLEQFSTCADAAQAAMTVSASNETYNNGAYYAVQGYVTSIATAYSDTYHNLTFWMADSPDGGQVLEAYKCVALSEAEAPAVGDLVKVTGKLTKYNTTPEFASGCTYQIIQKSACTVASGTCGAEGDNLTWQLGCDSVFTITGTGAMTVTDGDQWYANRMAISQLIVGEGVKNVGEAAFRQAENLREVVIGEGVTKIDDSAFWGSSGIRHVQFPNTLDTIEDQGFRSCAYMQSIILPASVRYLGSWAFAYCYIELDSIVCRATTPPTCGEEAFYEINTSTPLYVPARSLELYRAADVWKNFTNILPLPECIVASGTCGAQGDNVTWQLTCDGVMTISGTGAMASYTTNSNGQAPWAEYGSQIRDIIIEEGVTSLSAYGFYNAGSYTNGAYDNVRTLTIPSTVAKVVNNNFYKCPIETVTINSDSIVGQGGFSSGSTLQGIFGAQVRQYIIGDSVRSIANSAFYNQGADSLTTIVLPEGLQSIGTWAFGYLEQMTSIVIPNTVLTIGSDAFAGCNHLRSVHLGASLTSIGAQAFWKDTMITRVTCEALTPPTLGVQAFDVFDTLFVRCESRQLYKEADNWKNFSKFKCLDGGDELDEWAFPLGKNWTFVMLPTAFGMSAEDITSDGTIAWATYNCERRAQGNSGWENIDAAMVHIGQQALLVRAIDDTATLRINVPVRAQSMDTVYVPLSLHPAKHAENANWCFVGNPYPYGYLLSGLAAQGITSPIFVWNGTGYEFFTPGIDDFIIPAFGAFFIQLPEGTADAPTIIFTSTYIMM